MPRGKKNTPPPAAKKTPARKPRTTDPDGRIALADKKIAHLSALVAERKALVEKTDNILTQRRSVLAKTEQLLADVTKRRERIVLAKEAGSVKAYNRIRKAEEKEKVARLMEALNASGKSLDDVISQLSDQA